MMFIFAIGTVFGSIVMFERNILADGTWILVTLIFVGLHSVFNRFILEFRLKQQIRKQFETYLDPRQVTNITKRP